MNQTIIDLLFFTIFVINHPVEVPHTINIISINVPYVFIIVSGHGENSELPHLKTQAYWRIIWEALSWDSWMNPRHNHFRWICNTFEYGSFLPQLWQIKTDLVDNPPTQLLYLPLWLVLIPTFFADLLNRYSIATVYTFISKGSSLYFILLVAGSHRFDSTRLLYLCVASWKRDSYLISS